MSFFISQHTSLSLSHTQLHSRLFVRPSSSFETRRHNDFSESHLQIHSRSDSIPTAFLSSTSLAHDESAEGAQTGANRVQDALLGSERSLELFDVKRSICLRSNIEIEYETVFCPVVRDRFSLRCGVFFCRQSRSGVRLGNQRRRNRRRRRARLQQWLTGTLRMPTDGRLQRSVVGVGGKTRAAVARVDRLRRRHQSGN